MSKLIFNTQRFIWRNKDFQVLAIVLSLVCVFWFPALSLRLPLFFDDLAHFYYPEVVNLARNIQKGIFPLWDPYTFCGANPRCYDIETCIFYVPLYPFCLMANLTSEHSTYFFLTLLPLFVHALFGIIGSYFLGRKGLNLGPVGSGFLSIAWSFSPACMYMLNSPLGFFVLSYIPWIVMVLLLFIRTGRAFWLVSIAIFSAMIALVGFLRIVLYVYLMLGFFCSLQIFIVAWKQRWQEVRRILIGGITVVLGSIFLAAVYWICMIKGYILGREIPSFEFVTLQSMPPIYLVTLFIPNLFGSISGTHAWGCVLLQNRSFSFFANANILGGILIIFLVVMTIWQLFSHNRVVKVWSEEVSTTFRVMVVMSIIFVILTLGRYTPIYRFLYRIFPFIFAIPYASTYRLPLCFTLACLSGAGASLLIDSDIFRTLKFKIILLYLLIVWSSIIIVLTIPTQLPEDLWFKIPSRNLVPGASFFPGVRQIVSFDDIAWFLSGPIMYGVLATILLVFASLHFNSRYWRLILVGGALIELMLFGFFAFYYNTMIPRLNQYPLAREAAVHRRFIGPWAEPTYRSDSICRRDSSRQDPLFRWCFYRSTQDNVAYLDGSLSLLGYDSNPLDERFLRIIKPMIVGIPWELELIRPLPLLPLFRNMSVKYAIFFDNQATPQQLWEAFLSPSGIYEVEGVLPRLYFQDRIIIMPETEQIEALSSCDLQQAVVMNEAPLGTNFRAMTHLNKRASKDVLRHFANLQKDNRIEWIDVSNPNSIRLQVAMDQSAMLITTDVWHPEWEAKVNGKEANIYRVNYLQRGIWLKRGRHLLEMRFNPKVVRVGMWVTILSWSLLTLYLIGIGVRYFWHSLSYSVRMEE